MAEGTTGPQRAYRAPCPGCGAPVEFRSAQSTHAVCPYCQSTVVRQGDTLARIGKMAELFEDFSPLQLFASGRVEGQGFTLIGRLTYRYEGGQWTEWIAALDDGRSGTLSEDNGAFVFSLPFELTRDVPPAAALRLGMTTAFEGRGFVVTSVHEVSLVSAQGELPRLPALGDPFTVVELRGDGRDEVLSLEYDTQPPGAWLGRSVRLDELQLSGLRAETAREDQARSFSCPNCGASVTPVLPDSKSITCASCGSLIDLTSGIGGQLRHAVQDEPVQPLIALGATGKLQGGDWQVLGFQHRMGRAPDDDEAFGWSEYLLYNRMGGFSFLVDSEDGWSLVAPTTGAPRLASDGQSANHLGTRYALQYAYEARTTYVAGEFYWKVERGQTSFNRDFANGTALLSMEKSGQEITWSSGRRIDSAQVAAAFGQDARKALFKRSDAAPLSSAPRIGCGTAILILIVLIVLLIILSTCSGGGTSSGYGGRSAGGSYGGYSSGGSHK
jgi:DNA-directed RNA polymerase subunit RPC12/RpoP